VETAFPWNVSLFYLVNASANPNGAAVLIARALAEFAPWLAIAVLILYWFLGTADRRRSLMIAGVALGLGLAVNFSIAFAMYVPRPFELGMGNTLLAHGPETSFPSDHVTFLLSLGFGLLTTRPLRGLAVAIAGLGLATAWARVYLGVHFPLDMAASFGISLVSAILARSLSRKLAPVFFQPVERMNNMLLSAFSRKPKIDED
jgi:undecaprenyl-diphosphatase